jgi:hypothetical protein
MEHNGLSTFLGELFSPHTHTHTRAKYHIIKAIPEQEVGPKMTSYDAPAAAQRLSSSSVCFIYFQATFSLPLSLSLIFFSLSLFDQSA